MTDHLQTSENRSIASGAIGRMAWNLACQKAYGDPDALPIACLKCRESALRAPLVGSANEWYYRIIDNLDLWAAP